MFERFTKAVREIVRRAEQEARSLDASAVGTEHLLLALVSFHPMIVRPGFEATSVVVGRGELPPVVPDDASELRRLVERDASDALAAIGISLEDVRRRIETEFGQGAWEASAGDRRLPFNREAKDALHLALRAALETKTRRIGPWELALGLLRQGGRARSLVEELGVDPAETESRLLRLASGLVALASR